MQARILIFVLVAFLSSVNPAYSFAAIPIKEQPPKQQAIQKLYQKFNEASATQIGLALNKNEAAPYEKQEEKQDNGLIGSLAFAFGLIGIFPAAIVLGIIGMQRHRRERGLAIAGLVLGILGLLFFIAVVIMIKMVL